ncbi:MAG: hypothetical protein ARM1_0756 [Candidatus Micrarchaeota archaeon]|nr:MAG: hypothetical protein ARM1_0756 [Candidatus Micrarchaeota archaeon]
MDPFTTKYLAIGLVIGLLVGALVAYIGFHTASTNTNVKFIYLNRTINKTVIKDVYSNSSLFGKISSGFYDNNVVMLIYTKNYTCTPGISASMLNSTVDSLTKGCEIGILNNATYNSSVMKAYELIPAYTGFGVFGFYAIGADQYGFPQFSYNGSVYNIVTSCGASGSRADCNYTPSYVYSPFFSSLESLVSNHGIGGLPKGVLPLPSSDYLLTSVTNRSNPINIVAVLVLDPNIMPDPITGECSRIVQSNLSNPIADCLNSTTALYNALQTKDSAVAAANANNIVWKDLGEPEYQVIIPGLTSPSELANITNTNIILYFNATAQYPPVS